MADSTFTIGAPREEETTPGFTIGAPREETATGFTIGAPATPPEGVLPPPVEGMYSDIISPSLYQSFKASSAAPNFLAEDCQKTPILSMEAFQLGLLRVTRHTRCSPT